MPVPINVGGVWKDSIPWINVGGVWKKCSQVWVNVGGIWKMCLERAFTVRLDFSLVGAFAGEGVDVRAYRNSVLVDQVTFTNTSTGTTKTMYTLPGDTIKCGYFGTDVGHTVEPYGGLVVVKDTANNVLYSGTHPEGLIYAGSSFFYTFVLNSTMTGIKISEVKNTEPPP